MSASPANGTATIPIPLAADHSSPTDNDVQVAATALRISLGKRVSEPAAREARTNATMRPLVTSILDLDKTQRKGYAHEWVKIEELRNPDKAAYVARALKLAALIVEAEPNDPRPDHEVDTNSLDLEIVDAQSFLDKEFAYEWLVKGVLVEGQPTIIGGAEKALKTSIAMDLAISLAITRPFLGKYFVPTAKRVLFLSGESGPATLQGNMREMLKSKGAVPAMLGDRLHMGFRLPMLTDPAHLEVLKSELDRVKPEVLIIDPIYLCMGGDESQFDPRNLFKVGAILRTIDQICTERGVTLILVHHFRQRSEPYTPPELSDLSYAGFAQWLRQRIFVSRRSAYENDGMHLLRLDYGGSFGHQGRVEVDIDAGVLDENFQGRKWEVVVRAMPEAIAAQKEQREESRAKRLAAKDEDVSKATAANAAKILNVLKSWPEDRAPASTSIRDACMLSGACFGRAVEYLLATEAVEVRKIPRVKSAGPTMVEAIYPKPKDPTPGQIPGDSDDSDKTLGQIGLQDPDTHSDNRSLSVGENGDRRVCVSGADEPHSDERQDSDKICPSVEEGGAA